MMLFCHADSSGRMDRGSDEGVQGTDDSGQDEDLEGTDDSTGCSSGGASPGPSSEEEVEEHEQHPILPVQGSKPSKRKRDD